MWIERRLHNLRVTGKLNLAGEKDLDLEGLSNPKYAKELSIVKEMNLNRTSLKSFEGFPNMLKLSDLSVENTELKNFKNIRSFPNLRKISFKGSNDLGSKNLSLSVILAIPSISSVNGKLVSEKIKQKASEYPPIAGDLVNAGWIATYPVPDPPGNDRNPECPYRWGLR